MTAPTEKPERTRANSSPERAGQIANTPALTAFSAIALTAPRGA